MRGMGGEGKTAAELRSVSSIAKFTSGTDG